MEVAGSVALITGAASGLGRATATALRACQRSRNSPSLRGCPSRNSPTPSVT